MFLIHFVANIHSPRAPALYQNNPYHFPCKDLLFGMLKYFVTPPFWEKNAQLNALHKVIKTPNPQHWVFHVSRSNLEKLPRRIFVGWETKGFSKGQLFGDLANNQPKTSAQLTNEQKDILKPTNKPPSNLIPRKWIVSIRFFMVFRCF